jgi:hypothetical protein
MTWSQEAWGEEGKSGINGKNGIKYGIRRSEGKNKRKKKTKQRIHSHFNSIWLKRAFPTQSFM